MTISTTTNRYSYAGNGVTQAFAYSSKFLANSDLVVLLVDEDGVETVQTLNTDYTVTGAEAANGGTVTFTSAPSSDYSVVIYGDPAPTQTLDLVNGDNFDADDIERQLDRSALVSQRLKDLINRSLRLADSVVASVSLAINTVGGAGKFLRLANDGTEFELVDGSTTSDTYTASGTGAVSRAVSAKLSEVPSPEDYGAVGDGITDDIAAINAALQANTYVKLSPNKTYLIGSYVVPKTGTWLDARGSNVKLKNGANTHMVRLPDAVTDVTVEGGDWDGNKANQSGGNGFTNATGGTNRRLRLINPTIHDCFDHGVGWNGATTEYVIESGIIAYNNGASGVGSIEGIQKSVVSSSIAYSNGTSNFGGSGVAEYLAYVGCVGEDSGTADNFTGYGDGNKFIAGVGLVSVNGDNHGVHISGEHITLAAVAIDSPAAYGVVSRTDTGGAVVSTGFTMSAVTVKDAGLSSFWFDNNDAFAAAGVIGIGGASHNMYLDTANTNGYITGVFKGAGTDNVRLQTATDILVDAVGVDGTSDGVQWTNSTGCVIRGIYTGNAIGLNETGTSNNNIVSGVRAIGNTSDTPAFVGASTVVDTSLTGGTSVVTAASTITIPKNKQYIVLSGATAVDTINAWPVNDGPVVIRSDGSTSLTESGNLKLVSNPLNLTDRDCVILVPDGTNWYQAGPVAAN